MPTRFKLGALALGLLASLVGIELTLRIMKMGYGNSPVEPDPFLHHVHPRNYSFVQRHPSGEFGGFEVDYNADGRVYRGRASAPFTPPQRTAPCRLAIMGDSFAEAGQVPFSASYPGLLESTASQRCEVRNYGVRSYSPSVYLVQWTREILNWKPTDVFLLLFGNDIADDQGYMAAAVIGPDGFPTAIRGPEGGWLISQLRRLFSARFARTITMQLTWMWEHRGEDLMRIGGVVEENPDWVSPTTDMVLELNRRVRADGARLVIMVVPSRYKMMGDAKFRIDKDLHEKVKEWSAASNLEFLDLDEAFTRAARAGIPLFFRQDIHFNEEGHALTAAVIGRAYPALFSKWSEITSASVRAAYAEAAGR